MADQIPIFGHELLAFLGTQSGNAVTYGNVSLITADRNAKINTDWAVTNIIDPSDQSKPATPISRAVAKGFEVGGSGLFDKATGKAWMQWADNATAQPFKLDCTVFTYVGNAVCNWEISAGDTQEGTVAKVTISSSGPYTITYK